ncbi:CinA family protein [Pseudofrankia asymbiotica]|uniref:CinA C-terminal domain-containing protein n=1 Tax=Pseudofrankia asymbiotica TaxID=1834516 RepID=A0A1V2I9I6_9ACTN|nr:CinA family protein [Pseudofrankia asymbiotica]ONH27782.1 hypothetical protein BL253_21360 [Pseudofrankia asymbiotica]
MAAGIGVTGVAGPGEQDGRPVGEVFTATASPTATVVRRHELRGNRSDIRLASAMVALADFLDVLESDIQRA